MVVKLVALVSGQRKNGQGDWYKASLLGHDGNGKPIVNEFFLDQEVGEKAVRDGLLEDVEVRLQWDLDEYMRPTIVGLTRAAAVKPQAGA